MINIFIDKNDNEDALSVVKVSKISELHQIIDFTNNYQSDVVTKTLDTKNNCIDFLMVAVNDFLINISLRFLIGKTTKDGTYEESEFCYELSKETVNELIHKDVLSGVRPISKDIFNEIVEINNSNNIKNIEISLFGVYSVVGNNKVNNSDYEISNSNISKILRTHSTKINGVNDIINDVNKNKLGDIYDKKFNHVNFEVLILGQLIKPFVDEILNKVFIGNGSDQLTLLIETKRVLIQAFKKHYESNNTKLREVSNTIKNELYDRTKSKNNIYLSSSVGFGSVINYKGVLGIVNGLYIHSKHLDNKDPKNIIITFKLAHPIINSNGISQNIFSMSLHDYFNNKNL